MFFFYYNLNFFYLSFYYNFNYFNYLLFIKKNNSFFKKINIYSFNSNFIYTQKTIFNFYKDKNLIKLSFNTNVSNSSVRLVDLKKKFYSSFFQYINFSNMINNNKKIIKKKNKISNSILNLNYKLKNYYVINYQLFNILINSKFISSYTDYLYLIKKKFIYINRKLINNINFNIIFINKNSIIELLFFKKYYNFLLKIKNYSNIYKNIKFSYTNNSDIYKNKYIKRYINGIYFYFNKFITFEIDYKTLTLIVLKNYSYSLYNIFNNKAFWINIFLINMKKY